MFSNTPMVLICQPGPQTTSSTLYLLLHSLLQVLRCHQLQLHQYSVQYNRMQRVGHNLLSTAACLLLAIQLSSASRDVIKAPNSMLTSVVVDADSATAVTLTSAVTTPLTSSARSILQVQPAAANEGDSVEPAQFIFLYQYVQLTLTLSNRNCATAPSGLPALLRSAMVADVRRWVGPLFGRPDSWRGTPWGKMEPCFNVSVSLLVYLCVM
jgi:hypothetical protein